LSPPVCEALGPGEPVAGALAERLAAAERLGFEGVEFWGHDIRARMKEIRRATKAF